ncbi:SH3 domain-containing protein [Streptomyces sp. NPDC058992]|uniref:SH3 domain-containing protein n=1 Tax=Streptomyces sp. NPDC058992 TaxID=3346688 RepID=UPI00368E812C
MSRHCVSALVVSVLAASLFALPAPSAAGAAAHTTAASVPAKADFCRITASSTTVRAKPRKNAAALGTSYKGDTCTAHGRAGVDGTWVKVTIKRNRVTGYVPSSRVAWGVEELGSTAP